RVDIVVRRRTDQADAGRGVTDAGDVVVHLAARQLAAFAGLGALGYLDLQLIGIGQIPDGDAEAARGDLLDGRALGVAIVHGDEADGILAALTGVGLAAQAVHGDGQGFVALAGDGAQAHGAGSEALDDLARWLDFVR